MGSEARERKPGRPFKAAFWSASFPGAGQWWINGEPVKGGVMMVAFALLTAKVLSITMAKMNEALAGGMDMEELGNLSASSVAIPSWMSWALMLIWVGSVVDAVVVAWQLRKADRADDASS